VPPLDRSALATTAAGAAWRETWCEKAYHDEGTLELKIERNANKWARTESGGSSAVPPACIQPG